ncbi:hypothetical protein D3C84_981380 [compost metagenome]
MLGQQSDGILDLGVAGGKHLVKHGHLLRVNAEGADHSQLPSQYEGLTEAWDVTEVGNRARKTKGQNSCAAAGKGHLLVGPQQRFRHRLHSRGHGKVFRPQAHAH